MKANEFMTNMTRTFNKVGFKLKKHSPEILVVTGVIGTVASAVMACKATTKVADITADAKEQIHDLHLVSVAAGIEEQPADLTLDDADRIDVYAEMEQVQTYTEEDRKKDLTIIYAKTGLQFVKLYGPAVLLGALSITGILAGHNITRKRNIALAAAYATVDKGFKEYRARVVERFGKELDRELKYNIKSQEITETTVDEKGKEKTVTKTVDVADVNEISDYARFFDDGCTGWEKDAEHNLMFLKLQQNYANDILKSKGYLFLNDVYKMLGIPVTKAGQIVGWIYDEKNPNHKGDNFVDFGIYDLYNERKRAFVNGKERTILLDFNVDGNILDMI